MECWVPSATDAPGPTSLSLRDDGGGELARFTENIVIFSDLGLTGHSCVRILLALKLLISSPASFPDSG